MHLQSNGQIGKKRETQNEKSLKFSKNDSCHGFTPNVIILNKEYEIKVTAAVNVA